MMIYVDSDGSELMHMMLDFGYVMLFLDLMSLVGCVTRLDSGLITF